MLKSSQFHGYFCVGFVECPLLQNASKLLRSSPNFGQLPQKKVFERAGTAGKYDMILREKVGSGTKWPHHSYACTCRGLLICMYIYIYLYV